MEELSKAVEETRIEPVGPNERIHTLDAVRGFALLGILPINVQFFMRPSGDAFEIDWQNLSTLEYAIEFSRLAMVQGKLYALFSILFGIGFAIQLSRITRQGGIFPLRYLWRLVLLFAIGVAHAIVIWYGDILTTYAMGGVVLLVFFLFKRGADFLIRRLSRGRWHKLGPSSALVLAIAIIAVPMSIWAGISYQSTQLRAAVAAGETLTEKQKADWERLEKRRSPEAKKEREEKNAAERERYLTGSYAQLTQHRVERFSEGLLRMLPQLVMFTSLFLLGAYIGRRNFIGRAAELRSGFVKLLVVATAIGLPAALWFAWISATTTFETRSDWLLWQHNLAKTVSQYALALAYMAAIVLLMQRPIAKWLRHLAPVGRMAMTNYVLSSVLGTFFFYNYGLGMMTEVGPVGEMLFVLGASALLILFSHLWMKHFRFGPLEWLWRSASYLKLQPMRQSP